MNELGAHLANSLASASIHTNERVIVACSGGVDSVVLLHLAVHYFAANHIVVAHANHGLRGSESDGDASFVQDLTSSLGCEFVTTMLPVFEDVATSGRSIEESARVLRYEWLESVRLVHGASTVLVAHHLDDLVETMLYRIARGTGLRGLRAMRPRQGNIVRPLLGISRAEIESYARQHGLSWREDASNQDTSIHRNLLRHEVLPKLQTINPAYARAFERLSRYAQDVSEFIDDAVQEFLGDGDYFSILLFQERSDFFQREVIRYLYEQACDSTIGLSESSI
ncbi:MAG TPA: tRNA lysidine(34) synthetase TilS [bacterium]|nr:tRNA lysidine(34) synthetase TilS [bacterium]